MVVLLMVVTNKQDFRKLFDPRHVSPQCDVCVTPDILTVSICQGSGLA